MRILKVIAVFTPEPWQGFGYGDETNGKAIVNEGIAWLKSHGCTVIGLETMPRTMDNNGFYSTLGFLPGRLTITVTLDAAERDRAVSLAGSLAPRARGEAIAACRDLTRTLLPGYDFTREIELTLDLGLGDVVLLHDGAHVAGFALFHAASLVEGRSRGELRVLKMALADASMIEPMSQLLTEAARRAGTRRVAMAAEDRARIGEVRGEVVGAHVERGGGAVVDHRRAALDRAGPDHRRRGVPTTPSLQPSPARELGFISPVVAKIAAEQNVDLSRVPGTGMGNRITKKDIERYIETRKQSPLSPTLTASAAPTPTTIAQTGSLLQGSFTLLHQTPMRKSIAEHMVMSERTAPHVSTIMEVDMTRVLAHRNFNKDSFTNEGVNLTFTAYFVSASVSALKAYPLVNSSWSEDGVRVYSAIHIGMATALGDEGLIGLGLRQSGRGCH